MRVPVVLALVLLPISMAAAQSPADRLDQVADELGSIASDLEATQAQTAELRSRLNDLEALAADHRQALAAQDHLLAEYRASIEALEAHDRASLALATDLRGQLETERRLTQWMGPLTVVAVTAAVVEGLALGWRR